jgi:hypothetical protein
MPKKASRFKKRFASERSVIKQAQTESAWRAATSDAPKRAPQATALGPGA